MASLLPTQPCEGLAGAALWTTFKSGCPRPTHSCSIYVPPPFWPQNTQLPLPLPRALNPPYPTTPRTPPLFQVSVQFLANVCPSHFFLRTWLPFYLSPSRLAPPACNAVQRGAVSSLRAAAAAPPLPLVYSYPPNSLFDPAFSLPCLRPMSSTHPPGLGTPFFTPAHTHTHITPRLAQPPSAGQSSAAVHPAVCGHPCTFPAPALAPLCWHFALPPRR